MTEFAPPLFSTKINLGKRTFFFDVRNTKGNKPYLKITESSVQGEEKKRVNIAVFESEIAPFMEALTQAVEFIRLSSK